MESPRQFRVRPARWTQDSEAMRAIRSRVFIEEQQIPAELEWDGNDSQCMHVVAEDAAGNAIGTARMFPDGRIGRMAVLPPWRGQGVGTAIMEHLVATAKETGLTAVLLNAQDSALPFYEKTGFTIQGDGFMEAGIPHHLMVRVL